MWSFNCKERDSLLARHPPWSMIIFPPPLKKRHSLSTTWGRARQSTNWAQGTINNMHTQKQHSKMWIQLLYDHENHGLWTWLVSYKRHENHGFWTWLETRTAYPSQAPAFIPGFWCVLLLIFLVFLRPVYCVINVASVSGIVHSWLSVRFSLKFIYKSGMH